MADQRVQHLDFFFDPVCPWAWITSRWVTEVAAARDVEVTWRFIALRMVNEHRDYERDFPARYAFAHGAGLRLLRIAAAARYREGNDAVARWYTAIGTLLHTEGRSAPTWEAGEEALAGLVGDALQRAGLAETYAGERDDDAHDTVIRAETDLALERTGRDVGTPIITFDPGTEAEASFFGPVISRIPRGPEAVAVWDAVVTLARTPGMAELKRSLRSRPVFD